MKSLTKTPYLVLFILLITIGVGTSYALITITLDGDVVVTGDLSVGTDNPSDDDFIRFDGGNENIQWDESETLFRFSDHIATGGHAQFGSIIPDGVNRFGDGTPQSPEDMTGFGDLYLADDLEVTDNLFVGGDIDCEGCVEYSDLEGPPIRVPKQVPRFNVQSVVDTAGNVGVKNSITIGVDGFPIISYRDQSNTNLKVAKCNNPSCTSSIVNTVDSAGSVGHASSIAIGADGFPVISYRDSSNFDLKVAKCNNPSCSSALITTLDSAGDVGGYTSIAIGVEGLPVISYTYQTTHDLKFARCNNQNCSSATSVTVDSTGDVGKDSSMTMGVDGLPVISYKDLTNQNLKVIHCGNPSCSSGNIINTVDSVGELGWDTSITIGADGLPVISYVVSSGDDVIPHSLRVAKCANLTCSQSFFNTVDSIGFVGFDSSITIGLDGFPVISYYDTINDDLKVAKCNDLNCTSAAITTVKSTGDVGSDSSITIGFDGLPVISYYDGTSDELEVAKCANPLCLSLWTQR